jgi:uncharacterized membrane protein
MKYNSPTLTHPTRLLLTGIASIGAALTSYLTIAKLSGNTVACPTNGCEKVLSSVYSNIFGIPLPLMGLTAYITIGLLAIAPLLATSHQRRINEITNRLLFAGTLAMTNVSGYLLYLMIFKLQALCLYCSGSALLSLILFIIVLRNHRRQQLLIKGIGISLVVLLGSIGVYAQAEQSTNYTSQKPTSITHVQLIGKPKMGIGWDISSVSGQSELHLAQHLRSIGAKEYTAWWCPHCHEQKLLFGKQAYEQLSVIECDHVGKKAQPDTCDAARVESFPTWDIKGQRLVGKQTLEKLSEISGYTGSRNFRNTEPEKILISSAKRLPLLK